MWYYSCFWQEKIFAREGKKIIGYRFQSSYIFLPCIYHQINHCGSPKYEYKPSYKSIPSIWYCKHFWKAYKRIVNELIPKGEKKEVIKCLRESWMIHKNNPLIYSHNLLTHIHKIISFPNKLFLPCYQYWCIFKTKASILILHQKA